MLSEWGIILFEAKHELKEGSHADFFLLCGEHRAISTILRVASTLAFGAFVLLFAIPILQFAESSVTMFDTSLLDILKGFVKTSIFQFLFDLEIFSAALVILLSRYSKNIARKLCEIDDDFRRMLDERMDNDPFFRRFPFLK